MALTETAALVVKLSLAGNFSTQMQGAQKALGNFDAKLSKTEGRAYKAGQQIGTGIKNGLKVGAVGVGLLASQVALGLNSLIKLESAVAQTNAVIKSTGGVAGVTADQVRKLAEKYEDLNATVSDEVIQSSENLLLTFTNIRKDAFEPTLQAILDMNQAMGGGPDGLKTAVIQVGKALNDPAKGLAALQRVGVTFDATQVKRIKKLQSEGKLYEAQQVILGELQKEFGGSFLSGGQTTTGKVAKFTDSIEDLQRALATALLPTISKVADKLSAFLKDPAVVRGISDLGTQIASLFTDENLTTAADAIKGVFTAAQKAAGPVTAAVGAISSFIGQAVSAFTKLPPELQTLIVGGVAVNKLTGGLVTNLGGGLISATVNKVLKSFSGVVNVSGGVVNVNGGVGLGGAAASGGGGAVGAVKGLLIPVAIAAISIEAAGAIGKALDPQLGAALDDPSGAHGTPLGNRDPRRFNKNGQVVTNVANPKSITNPISNDIESLRGAISRGLTHTAASIASKEALVAAETRRVKSAVDRKNLSVTVRSNVSTNLNVNGRKFQVALHKDNVIVNGKERT